MKTLSCSFLSICLLFTITSMGQNSNKLSPDKDWVKMMQDPKANVHDVQKAFYDSYYKTHAKHESPKKGRVEAGEKENDGGYTLFKRWEWFNLQRADIKGNRVAPDKIANDYRNYLHSSRSAHRSSHSVGSTGTWTYAGNTTTPKYDTIYTSSSYGGNGRVNRVRIMPGNGLTMFACTPAGGLWKTTNAGITWTTNTDQLGDLFTSDIAINPANTKIMYLATGDGDGILNGDLGDYNTPGTVGILKSYDGGNTWNPTSFTSSLDSASANYFCVTELLINPNDTSVILAATTAGIYRSSNSGATWTLIQPGFFHSIEFEPGHPSIVYAASETFNYYAGFFRSTDNGMTFTQTTSGLPANGNVDRMEIGVTPADTSVVYLVADSLETSGFEGLYRSNDHGLTFTTATKYIDSTNDLLGWNCTANDAGDPGQAWYDLSISVSQINSNAVWVGGVNIWKTSNGGKTWTLGTDWTGGECAGVPYVHADIHWIQSFPGATSKYVVGCDGGVFVTPNSGATWQDISSNLGNAQQYCISASASTPGMWLSGWQDNGTNLSGSSWYNVLGGDGMNCFIDWSSNNNLYAEFNDGQLVSSSDAGLEWYYDYNGITESGEWATPWIQDPQTPATLYAGFQNMWKSTNQGNDWFPISTWDSAAYINAFAVDSSNTNYIYAANWNFLNFGGGPGTIEVTSNGGTTWTNITGTLPVDSAVISAIAIDSKNPSHVWVTFSGYNSSSKVFASTDYGTTWTNISSGLPNLPVNCIVSQSGSPDGIYVGTDRGIYYHDTLLNSWIFYNTGLPLVMVNHLTIYQPTKTLLAATFGRGTWQTPLYMPFMVSATIKSNVSCNGGANGIATATASNGTSPYAYSWSTGSTSYSVNGLSAGTYTVTATDKNALTASTTVVITQPSAISITPSGTNISCNGAANGTVTATVSGGTSPYKYSWSNGSTNVVNTGLKPGAYKLTIKDNNGCTATSTVTISQPPVLTVSFSVSNVSCAGMSNGSLSASASNGKTPYTYSWSNANTGSIISGLSPGTFTVTITDSNGCSNTASAKITQPKALSDSVVSQTNVICHGTSTASVDIGVATGANPFTFSWSPTGKTNQIATGLSAGMYTVTITNHSGCSNTLGVTITQPVQLSVVSSQLSAVTCHGGNNGIVSATPSGGTTPYTYMWSGGGTNSTKTGLIAGTYTVTLKDKCGASATASVTITQPTAVTITIANHTNAVCYGGKGSATANAATGGTSPYAYRWTPIADTNLVASNMSAGTYTITATDYHGCTATAQVSITQPRQMRDSVVSQTNELCNGNSTASVSIGVTVGGNPFTFSWSPTGKTNQVATGLSAGTYTVTVTNHTGCSNTLGVTITQPALLSVSASVTANVSSNGGSNGSASTSVGGGTSPYTYSWSDKQTTANATGLSAGTYTVTVKDNNKCTAAASVTITQPALNTCKLTVSIDSVVNVRCFGGSTGSANALTSSGTSPFTYSWSDNQTTARATGLRGGTDSIRVVYTVTVTDNKGCTATASVTITQPSSPLFVNASVTTNVSSNGGSNGSASASAGGGTSPYIYSWSDNQTTPNAKGLSAGTYTVTATDNNGCNAMALVTITQPASNTCTLNVSIDSVMNVRCDSGSNGRANALTSGGTSPFTYSWSSGAGTNRTAFNLRSGIYTVTVTDNKGCTATASVFITQPSAIIVSASVNANASCNGCSNGSAVVKASGGTAPLTYFWSDSQSAATATGLSAGTYTITVTDANGCNAMASVTITQPALNICTLNVSIDSVMNVRCFGGNTGSATALTSGGTSPFTYSWSNNQTTGRATGLHGGNDSIRTVYTVTVTDNKGCTATASVTITQPSGPLFVNASVTANVSSNGGSNGSASSSAGGGTSPYMYSWSDNQTAANVTGLSAGIYTVTATDNNGCNAMASVTITQPASRDTLCTLNVSIDSVLNINCFGGNNGRASALTSGGTLPFTYFWSPGGATSRTAFNLNAGTYSLFVTDNNGCTASAPVTIIQPAAIKDSGTVLFCDSTTGGFARIGVTGGTSPYSYNWSPGGGSNATMLVSNGTYTITVTDNNGCTGNTVMLRINCVTAPPRRNGTGDNTPGCCADNQSLYPNPNTGQFTISGIEKGMFIEIYDYTGRRISNITVSDETMQLNLSTQANGMYLIRIISKDGTLVSQKKVVKTE